MTGNAKMKNRTTISAAMLISPAMITNRQAPSAVMTAKHGPPDPVGAVAALEVDVGAVVLLLDLPGDVLPLAFVWRRGAWFSSARPARISATSCHENVWFLNRSAAYLLAVALLGSPNTVGLPRLVEHVSVHRRDRHQRPTVEGAVGGGGERVVDLVGGRPDAAVEQAGGFERGAEEEHGDGTGSRSATRRGT